MGREGPGAPRSQCQVGPVGQVARAGLGHSLLWDPECQDSLGAQEGLACRSRRIRRRHQVHRAPLSALRPHGHPSRPSSGPPAAEGQAGTGLGLRVGPPLLCHPSVLKDPGSLAGLGVLGDWSPQMHCCHTQAFREVLGALEALVGQADPAARSQCWRLLALPSPPSGHSFRGDPAALGSQCPPCVLVVHRDPEVHGSQAPPWLLSERAPLLCHLGLGPCLAPPSHPWVLGGPVRLGSPGRPLAPPVQGSQQSQVCPQVQGQLPRPCLVPTHRRPAPGVPGGRGGQAARLHPCLGRPSLLCCLCRLSCPVRPLHPLCLEGRETHGHPRLRPLP